MCKWSHLRLKSHLQCQMRFLITKSHRITEILECLRSYFHFGMIYSSGRDKNVLTECDFKINLRWTMNIEDIWRRWWCMKFPSLGYFELKDNDHHRNRGVYALYSFENLPCLMFDEIFDDIHDLIIPADFTNDIIRRRLLDWATEMTDVFNTAHNETCLLKIDFFKRTALGIKWTAFVYIRFQNSKKRVSA